MKYLFYTLALGAAVGGILLFFLSRGRWGRRSLDLEKRFAVVDAEVDAKKLKARLGHAEAVRVIEARYEEEINALDERQRAEAVRLRHDPVSLSRYLVQVGSGG